MDSIRDVTLKPVTTTPVTLALQGATTLRSFTTQRKPWRKLTLWKVWVYCVTPKKVFWHLKV